MHTEGSSLDSASVDFNKTVYNRVAGQKAEWNKPRGGWDVRMLRQQEASAVGEIWKRDSTVT